MLGYILAGEDNHLGALDISLSVGFLPRYGSGQWEHGRMPAEKSGRACNGYINVFL